MDELIAAIETTSSVGGKVQWEQRIPEKITRHLLTASEAACGFHGPNLMLAQRIRGREFECFDSRFFNQTDSTVQLKANIALLELRIPFINHFPSDWDGFGFTDLLEKQTELNYVPFTNNEAKFSKGIHCRTVDFHVSPDFLEKYASRYDAIGHFLEKVANDKPAILLDQSFFLSPLMIAHINHILEYKGSPENAAHYYDGAFHQLMMLLFDKIGSEEIKKPKFSAYDKERTLAARDALMKDLSKKIFITDLAKMVAINHTTLQECFKEMFSTTIHDYMTTVRMNKAFEMLLTTDKLIENIAIELGFSEHSALTRAFKEHFKHTPDYLRKHGKIG